MMFLEFSEHLQSIGLELSQVLKQEELFSREADRLLFAKGNSVISEEDKELVVSESRSEFWEKVRSLQAAGSSREDILALL